MSNVLKNVFKDYTKENNISNCQVENINLFKKTNKLVIYLKSNIGIKLEELDNFEEYLQKKFNVENIEFNINYDIEINCTLDEDLDAIIKYISKKYPLTKPILNTSTFLIEGKNICLTLMTKSADFLRSYKLDKIIENLIYNLYNKKYRVIYKENIKGEITEKQNSYLRQIEQEECKNLIANLNQVCEPKQTNAKTSKKDNNLIIGRSLNIKEPIVKIKELNIDYEKVAIEGKVIKVDFRELKNGKMLIIFDLYDGTSTITCKSFIDKKDFNFVLDRVREAKRLKILGKLQYDTFTKELGVIANTIIENTDSLEVEERKDVAKEKRVELHMHTQMSQMDGVSSATDLIKQAAKFNMTAIAITDHGVVQAFPEAKKISDNLGIKVIYGVEAYLVPDIIENVDIPNEYCILDIETTGLAFRTEKITEIRSDKGKKW